VTDRRTLAAYDDGAGRYAAERGAYDAEAAAAFGRAVEGWRVDLGCGPGLYLPHLGSPVLAVDASLPMLREAAAPFAVQADVSALPVRRGSLGGAWASRCHQHLPHEALPAALADLHRSMAVGAPLELMVFAGDGTLVTGEDDDLPGRRFSLWSPDRLVDVLVGAGFDVGDVSVGSERWPVLRVSAVRARTLADHVGPGMRLLVCGLNPSLYAADRGVSFARPGNRFWPALLAAGLVSVDRDPSHALRHHGIGMTDLVKRATVAASSLTAEEYAAGVARVERLCAWLRPGALCLVGLSGWRSAVDRRAVAGWQPGSLGGVPVYVMPSTSGLNASTQHEGFVEHLRAAVRGPGSPATGSGT
jgi:TDG/mug DNA glycosylase family protein